MEEPNINELPDDLILKIFSLLPMFKENVATHLLSKRWENPWKLVSDVMFDDDYESYESLVTFLKRLHLKLSRNYLDSDISFWVNIAVNRSVRKLRIHVWKNAKTAKLLDLHLLSVNSSGDETIPSLLQVCPVLEYLVVNQTKDDDVMFKVVPPWFCLPSLKSLHLLSIKFSGDEALAKLLEGCEVLDNLVVKRTQDDNVMIFNINVPSLKSLSVENFKGKRAYVEENHGFVINAPLEKLNFKDTFSNFLKFEHMPKTPYPSGTISPCIDHLELCTCSGGWANLLASILNDAPRLRSLKLKSQHRARYNDPMNLWNEPTVNPECLSTHLEILEWRQYEGTEQERNVAAYVLANATCLKMATFSTRCRNKYHRMLKKLKKLKRVSEICQLVFE
ncbi:hypothetical protein BRARA_B01261 [Brassica rapa]|uniref:F-box domain-containing protein n=1 Tax=Brassica campestris TaxID=3711 RepID=A0A398ABC3_BRACM|nr:hypothetical protein BRARA_B01261 [Brassica rapa]